MYIIDRFEGDIAVVEADETMLDIPRSQLPAEAQEGDVLQKMGMCMSSTAPQQKNEKKKSTA